MFVSLYRRQDRKVAEMLSSTFRSYRSIYTEHGKDILEIKIRLYDGLIFVPCSGSSTDLCYRYPNELKDFVFRRARCQAVLFPSPGRFDVSPFHINHAPDPTRPACYQSNSPVGESNDRRPMVCGSRRDQRLRYMRRQ